MLPLQEAWASFVTGSDMAYGFKKCCADGAQENFRFWKEEAEMGRDTGYYCGLLGVSEAAEENRSVNNNG